MSDDQVPPMLVGPLTSAASASEPRDETRLRVFADRRLLALVAAVPVLTAGALVAFQFFPGDPMLASGLGAVITGFVVFLLFVLRVPDTFALVRMRGLVAEGERQAYAAFEHQVGAALNSGWSALFAAAGAVAGFARYPVEAGGFGPLLGEGPAAMRQWGPIALGDVVGEMLIGAAAGLAIWRMIVVGVKVHQLGAFHLRVQLGHPDGCGGFEPLGNLCLWNALILAVPGVWLGWWIIIGPDSQYGSVYVFLHSVLASAVMLFATIAFVLPLWSVHGAMARSAAGLRDDVEQYGQRIDRLARELVSAQDDLQPDAAEAKARELERLQALYRANAHVPTWPIDTRLLTKFGTSQLVPLLGVTGISKPMLDAVKAITAFIDRGA